MGRTLPWRVVACASLVCLMACPAIAQQLTAPEAASPEASAVGAADSQFQTGDFDAAGETYARVAATDPMNFRAVTRLGYLALLSNHLSSARTWLAQAVKINPQIPTPNRLMAESYVREDQFSQAAALYRIGGDTAQADQLASFAGQTPYAVSQPQRTVTVKFVRTDPLPVVQLRVNGGAPVNFFIDTGASDLVLDSDYARELGATQFGGQTGTFAGGKQAPFQRGRIRSLTMGGMLVRNVPVLILPVRPLAQIFGGLRLDGIIGTVLLYHFLATIDYPHGRLVLAPRSQAPPATTTAVSIPFWMAGDHFMVAHGTLNGGTSRLFLVDTGLAGGGFSAPLDTLTESGITLDTTRAGSGVGGGGAVQVTPFTVTTLTLGPAVQHSITGLFTGPFPFEDAFGFHLSGLISHGFFRSYALTLDFDDMRLLLK